MKRQKKAARAARPVRRARLAAPLRDSSYPPRRDHRSKKYADGRDKNGRRPHFARGGTEYLTMVDIAAITGLSLMTIHRMRRKPALAFPQPVQLSPGRKAFLREEIDDWLAARARG